MAQSGVKKDQMNQDKMLSSLYGTFAAENMVLRDTTRRNLNRIVSGQASYQQVLNELRLKYSRSN